MQTLGLEDKVALITGASRGLGAEIARLFSKLGAKVAINQRGSAESAARACALVKSMPEPAVMAFTADVTEQVEVKEMVKAVNDYFGPIDILVNNAGIQKDDMFIRSKPQDFLDVYNVNVVGAQICSRAVLPGMIRAGGGSIVMMSSMIGISGNRAQEGYAASKAGMIALMKSLARDFGEKNIRVNAVAPGWVDGGMTLDMNTEIREREWAKWRPMISLDRMATPLEVAQAVAFLASDWASYITGHVLTIDGGWFTP